MIARCAGGDVRASSVLGIVAIQGIGVGEDGGGLLKRDAMLLEVRDGLRNVPCKHSIVYTLIACMPQD